MNRASIAAVLMVLLLLAGQAMAVEIHGNIITDYHDGQKNLGPAGWQNTTANGQFRLTSVGLMVSHDFNDFSRAFIRTSNFRGGNMTVPEAWMAFDGLPWNGTLTVGRFFTPGGEPLPLIGVPIPTIAYRSQAQNGLKLRFDPNTNWRTEWGFTNLNPLSTTGAVIGDAYIIARPTAAPNSQLKRVYGHLGYQNGGSWGSLDLSGTVYQSRLSQTDKNTLNTAQIPLNAVPGTVDNLHRVIDLSADYLYGRYHAYGQWIRGQEGDFHQSTWEAAGSVRFGAFTYLVSYGILRNNAYKRGVNDGSPIALNNGITWNRNRLVYSIAWEITPSLKLQAEYETNHEFVGIPGNHNPVENNAIGVQLYASF